MVKKDFPKLVYFEVEHDNCWTHLTEKNNLKIRLLYQKFDITKPLFNSVIIGYSDYKSDLKEFARQVKYHKSVNGIDGMRFNENLFLMNLSLVRDGSVSKIIHNNGGIILSHEIKEGIEKWMVLTENPYKLKDDIEIDKNSNLIKFKFVNAEEFLYNSLLDLTESEAITLKLAIDNGFFEYPHKTSVEELAKRLNLSKATFVKHLRTANKKFLMRNYHELLFSNFSMNYSRDSG
ncbi:hypothetical protein DDW09_02475 [Sulfolobus sp. SCGC AB-777_L09]|nr:hypothetical protein DDW09_02475 [Sulfolobus sp. SCGC AB-777_L09]